MPKDSGLQELLDNSSNPFETLTHYNGTVNIYYDSPLHAYYRLSDDGQKILIPGVTTVVGMIDKSGPLTQWAANMVVQWVIENFPVGQDDDGHIHQTLSSFYQQMRDKLPWEEFSAQADMTLSVGAQQLVKLLNDARFNYKAISKEATDIGHIAHKWLEEYIIDMINGVPHTSTLPNTWEVEVGGPTQEMLEKATRCIQAALEWMDKHAFTPVHSERKIYSLTYDYAGTLDWIAHITSCGDPKCCPFHGTVRALGDFKSSRSLYDEYRAQTASYQAAWQEEFPDQPIAVRVLLRLGKDSGDFESMTMTEDEFERDFDGFLGTLQMYGWSKQLELDRKHEKALAKAAAKALEPPKKRRAPKKIVVPGHQEYTPIPIAS